MKTETKNEIRARLSQAGGTFDLGEIKPAMLQTADRGGVAAQPCNLKALNTRGLEVWFFEPGKYQATHVHTFVAN